MDKQKIRQIVTYSLAAVGIVAILLGLFFWLRGGFNKKIGLNRNYLAYESQGIGGQAPMVDKSYEQDSIASSNSAGGEYGANEISTRKVTKNGELELLVQKAEEVGKKITDKTLELGGFIQSVNIREIEPGVKSGSITVKVPADKFDQAFNAFKDYGIKVEREITNAQDVTERYIDLEAQLKNLRAEEARYLEVMEKADKVEDILKVSQYLSRVRGQIERIEGQLKYLDRQVDMSTITAYLTAEAEVEVFGLRWRPLYEIKKSFRQMLEGVQDYTSALIAFVLYLPVIALWLGSLGFIAWLIYRVIKWALHRKNKKPPITY